MEELKDLYNLERFIRDYGITSIQTKEIDEIIDELYFDLKNGKKITPYDFEDKIKAISGWERKMDHTFCEYMLLGYIFSKHDTRCIQLFKEIYLHFPKFQYNKLLLTAIDEIAYKIDKDNVGNL